MWIRLFAGAREAAGASRIQVEINQPLTARELRKHLAAAEPALARILPYCAIAVDAEYVSDEDLIQAGREVAVIPPVSGGTEPCSEVR
jgi:molybdopterin converting factor subunit 1